MEKIRNRTYEELVAEIEAMRWQLEEANDTIHAIRTGQVDALIVQSGDGPQLYSLKTADQTYRVFIEKMNEGALTLDEKGVILYCNSRFARMVNQPLAHVLGVPFIQFVTEEYRASFEELFRRGWQGDTKEEMSILGDGKSIPCQLSATTLQLDEGISLSVIVTDLSYQKEAQAMLRTNNEQLKAAIGALEKSNYDLLQFASVASHDLQEPLRKIMVFSGMLAKKLPPESADETALIINKIAVSSQRMKSMISDILAYSRLSRDSIAIELVDLNKVLDEIIDDFEILIAEKRAVIEVDKLPLIRGSHGQMRQAFQNLLSNALKFSRPDVPPRIKVSCVYAHDGTSCTISVVDNGIGFDQQYHEKVFALFHRLNTKDQYEGSGIGLAITKKIIDKHDGHITAFSEEGKGSTFKISLPIVL